MTRQDQFEKAYAAHHDVRPNTVKSLRFHDAESYSDPRVAHDYRIFCLALDSVDLEQIIRDAYHAGWDRSGEGWNAEYPDGAKLKSWWIDGLEAYLEDQGVKVRVAK